MGIYEKFINYSKRLKLAENLFKMIKKDFKEVIGDENTLTEDDIDTLNIEELGDDEDLM